MPAPALSIRTPSRLHFGLLGWGPRCSRQFGGLGLMIDDPGLSLTLEPAPEWSAAGPHADRALQVARDVAQRLAESGLAPPRARIMIDHAPPAHVGLGLGTQLSLAVARGIAALAGRSSPPLEELAALTGRGLRSGIGLHGFREGGFLVDGGRGPSATIPARVARQDFPDDWRILVAIPDTPAGLHGRDETRAFETLAAWPEASTDRLCRLVLLNLLPALVERDLPAFGVALRAIQDEVGRGFAPIQGGPYTPPWSPDLLRRLDTSGITGLGQSSWGPTLYGFATADAAASVDPMRLLSDLCPEVPVRAFWTRASNAGASLS